MDVEKVLLLVLLLIGIGQQRLFAQGSEKHGPSLLGSNAEGVHFVVGFMQNETDVCSPYTIYRVVSIASRFATNVTIVLPDRTRIQRTLKPFEIITESIDERFECFGEGVFHNGIEITSTEPISVYCYDSRHLTSDGYLAIPVGGWGTQYVTANYYLDHYSARDTTDFMQFACDDAPRGGEFAVIAAEENTVVSVYPRVKTVTGYSCGSDDDPDAPQGRHASGAGWREDRGATDMTGSVVVSDKPVGVLSGHVRAGVSYQYNTKDHLIEMLSPREMLSDHHIVIPFSGRQGGDLVRVIAAEPGVTSVSINTASGGLKNYTLNDVGDRVDYDMFEVSTIVSDKPVLVAQYSRSAGADPVNKYVGISQTPPNPFDPNMVVVTPTVQYVNAAVFQTLPNRYTTNPNVPAQFDRHFMTVISEADAFRRVELDGKKLSDYPGLVSGPVWDAGREYTWAVAQVSDGTTHVLTSDGLLGGYVYGLGTYDSYAWPIGSGMRRLRQSDDSRPRFTVEKVCDRYRLRALDSGVFESGLRRVWLDSSASTNVRLQQGIGINGDDFRTGSLATIDPHLPGKACVIAEDIFHNCDTFNLVLDVVAPDFSDSSIKLSHTGDGRSYPRTISLSNPGSGAMIVDSVALLRGTEFVLQTTGYVNQVVAAGTSIPVTVTFKSGTKQNFSDTLLVWCNCRLYRIPLSAEVHGALIATEDLEYGPIRVSRNRLLNLHVRNVGGDLLRIDSIAIDKGVYSNMSVLQYPLNIQLDAGADTTIPVRFDPSAVGGFLGRVRFFSSADSVVLTDGTTTFGSVATARLHGVGVYPIITIARYDFGAWQVGDSASARVAITNIGDDTAHVTGVDLEDPAAFILDRSVFPRRLARGDTLWLPVRFAPLAEKSYSTKTFVRNDDGLEATGMLTGNGYVLQAQIDGYDWGERWVGSVHDTIVLVRNITSHPITIDRVWIDAGDIGEFKAEPLLSPVLLDVGASTPVQVRFSPLMPGLRQSIIRASTNSRVVPVIENTLQGVGLFALASDQLEFDASLAYSCEVRSGRVKIKNNGNSALTIASITLSASPALVQGNLPAPGYRIAVGDVLEVGFAVDFAGRSDSVNGSLAWSFQEIPGTFSREFGVRSHEQSYGISIVTPSALPASKIMDVRVMVDTAFWKRLPLQDEVTLRLTYNPTLAHFKTDLWSSRVDTVTGNWRSAGDPVIDSKGVLTLRFKTVNGLPAALDGVVFPPIPFWVFIGDQQFDTLSVTMSTLAAGCVVPATASLPYRIDSICGLSQRLFTFTGDPYMLRQNRPNPAGAQTDIEFTIGMEAPTRLELYACRWKRLPDSAGPISGPRTLCYRS